MSLTTLLCRYNGRAVDPPPKFPPEMEEACEIVERIVNQEMKKRQRFKLEWSGSVTRDADSLWRANVAASNRYQGGKESVGFHCDQLTYLGPYPTIASLSLGKDLYIFCYKLELMFCCSGTRRNFSLREVIPIRQKGLKKSQTFNIPLAHNSVRIKLFFSQFPLLIPDAVSLSLSSLQSCMLPAKRNSNTQSLLNQLSTFSSHHFHANLEVLLNSLTAASTLHSVFTARISDRPVYLDVTVESLLFCGLI